MLAGEIIYWSIRVAMTVVFMALIAGLGWFLTAGPGPRKRR